MMECGISLPPLPHQSNGGKSSIGITESENLHKVGGSLKRLRQAQALLWQGKVDETMALFDGMQRKTTRKTFALIWKSIVIALSTMTTTKRRASVPLVLGQLNRPLSKLTVESKYLALNGRRKMCPKSWPTALPISMDYSL